MMFGDQQTFALSCIEAGSTEQDMLLGVSLLVASEEIGDSQAMSPAGTIVHAANVFLKYSGSRDIAPCEPRAAFEALYSSMYGDNWRIGVAAQHRAKFALHEVLDVSVSDQGWLVFLVDFGLTSCVLLGKRGVGYLDHQVVPLGYAEGVLCELLDWIRRT